MIQNCKSELQKMTQDLENGMTIAMSVWSSWDFSWLQHGRCSGSCTEENLGFKNLVFTTASGNSADQDQNNDDDNGDDEDDGGNTGDDEGEGNGDEEDGDGADENQDGGSVDIAAGFAAIKNNPHYSEHTLSRTLYQVDQSFDFIEEKMIAFQHVLNTLND